jgi:abortive infection bacteriophage resistance protein
MSSGPLAKIAYTKPWLSVADQVAKLEARGLQVDDRAEAEAFLRHVNYYRFTGYCLAFENPRHSFPAGVTFSGVVTAYRFDSTLRDLFVEALELIEIDLRTSLAHSFGKTYGAFGHTLPASFHRRFDFKTTHADWLKKLREETTRSNELFVKHFRTKYAEYPDLPIWAVTEVMSFGSLSRMIGALHKHDRQAVADEYGVPAKVLSSATHHFAYARNLCAHHCRLWDRIWSIKPDLPRHADWQPPNVVSNERLFSTLLLMRQFLQRSSEIKDESDRWRDRMNDLLSDRPRWPTLRHSWG